MTNKVYSKKEKERTNAILRFTIAS
jgi:MoaA/NifB/PqqE/SkfB family radical SAM enzyme